MASIIGGKIDCPFEGIISPEECGKKISIRCEYCFIYQAAEDLEHFDEPKEFKVGHEAVN